MYQIENLRKSPFVLLSLIGFVFSTFAQQNKLTLNDQEYFEMPGLNVMLFHDNYPEGHQGGVTIIQHGVRVASNGDLRLEAAPGQWQLVPKVGQRVVDAKNQLVSLSCTYPDSARNRKGFNPIDYPDLNIQYWIRVQAEGNSVRIMIDLEKPLPAEWLGKVGFNLEFFPAILFGKTFNMDGMTGIFPRQLNGPMIRRENGELENQPLAEGKKLVIAPECELQRMTILSQKAQLQLIDGRALHNNGWFIVRAPITEASTQNAVELTITPHVLPDWTYQPVIHVSQVGYFPQQSKIAVIECDQREKGEQVAYLKRILPDGQLETVLSQKPESWGKFLRYLYFRLDFSKIREPGMYRITYRESKTEPFKIDNDIFDRHVWQPTLDYFLPVQMCHVRVNDRYRVWHGLCHNDDVRMAPPNTNHFDGYLQGSSTLTKYKGLDPVPGLNVGGWHDAGDYDLRVESQGGTVRVLAMIYEAFQIDYDETTIDQAKKLVELHRPDGKPDILQQIEHGVLTILAGYKSLGRLYRGIICSDLRQYVLLGDGATMTDNKIENSAKHESGKNIGKPDDRWVFTEENPGRELSVAGCLAAAARVLQKYDKNLATECLNVAEALWKKNKDVDRLSFQKIDALAELILTTEKSEYKEYLKSMSPEIPRSAWRNGWLLGRVLPLINDKAFSQTVHDAIRSYASRIEDEVKANPFGVPYRPQIWGPGWNIQRFGVEQYYLHLAFPDIISKEYMLNALNFMLGCHPGENTASFASGVGSKSATIAYGANRADWSYIPGGVISGTALIRPDLPELKEFPFLWQQTEYVIGGGASNFMFLVLAARQLLREN